MIAVQCYAVTCIIYNGLWGRKSKLPCAFGPHLLGELMSRKSNKWCKKHANIPGPFMWPLSVITLSVPTVNCLYKVGNPFHVPRLLFCLNFSIWFAHLGDVKRGGTQPPNTLLLWSDPYMVFFVIAHNHSSLSQTSPVLIFCFERLNEVSFETFKQTLSLEKWQYFPV